MAADRQDRQFQLVQNRALPIVFASSAGGVFSALAGPVLRAGGLVGGAVWTDDLRVRMELVGDRDGLARLRGAKYLKAEEADFLPKVREAVASGREVLVCALPCQVAELRRELGSPGNLTLVDLACGGIPPEAEFRAWVRELETAQGARVSEMRFETKEFNAWRHLAKVTFANRRTRFVVPEDVAFLRKCLLGCAEREDCAACPHRGVGNSEADITLGALRGRTFGQWRQREHLGVSKVLVRSAKGAAACEKAEPALDAIQTDERPILIAGRVWNHPKLRFGSRIVAVCAAIRKMHFDPLRVWRMFQANGIRRIAYGHPQIKLKDRFCRPRIEGKLQLFGDVVMGFHCEPVRRTSETILYVGEGGELKVRGKFLLSQGSLMLVSGKMEIGEECGFNDDAYILCEERVVLGRDVRAGRCVTIRDTNGGHWMNSPGFRVTKPVVIGDHVWLCEGCTIMPGVTIGSGAVVGARAVVFNNVPPNSLVIGNPAKVVCSGVEWKE